MLYTERLKNAREDFDLSQKEVAAEIGITQQQYQLYESGKRLLPITKLIELCKFYNLSSDYLLGLSDETKSFE